MAAIFLLGILMDSFTTAATATVSSRSAWRVGLTLIAALAALAPAYRGLRSTSTCSLSAQLTLALLAVNYVLAFWSMRSQIVGLAGRRGIMPYCGRVHELSQVCARRKASSDLGARVNRVLYAVLRRIERDDQLVLLCDVGAAAGLAICAAQLRAFCWLQLLQVPLLLIAWTAYRAVKWLTARFTSLQWDALLLEAGVVALPAAVPFTPPWCRAALTWPLALLLFKLMFSSGICKLRSGCVEWESLNAMRFHYETQPLPHGLSYFFHTLSKPLQRFSAFATLVIEVAVPFLTFGTAPCRAVAATLFMGLMLLIAVSGNYGFFNTLTAALSITLLDDDALRYMFAWWLPEIEGGERWWDLACPSDHAMACAFVAELGVVLWIVSSKCGALRSLAADAGAVWACVWFGAAAAVIFSPVRGPWCLACGSAVIGCVAASLLAMGTLAPIFTSVHRLHPSPQSLIPTWLCPRHLWTCFALVIKQLKGVGVGGSYGLFARMTTVRGELVLKGSMTGAEEGEWREYEWRYKPGNIDRMPVLVQPGHMPRLDWRVWFIPLALMRGRPLPLWFDAFIERILTVRLTHTHLTLLFSRSLTLSPILFPTQRSPAVMKLLGRDPFENRPPPRFIRVEVYDYRFTGSCNEATDDNRASLQFMPSAEAGPREVGKWWTRRRIGIVKTYGNENDYDFRNASDDPLASRAEVE